MPIEPTSPDPVPTSDFAAAYDKHLPDILAVKDDQLIAMNLDPRAVAFTVLGSLPEIRAFEPTIRELPTYPIAPFESLEGLAQALYYAHVLFLGAFPADDEVGALYLDAIRRREVLLSDTAALVKRGLVPQKRVDSFKGMSGFKNVSSDLLGLAEVLDGCWPAIDGNSAIKRADLQQAREAAERLVRAASLREQSPSVTAEAQHTRQRAYTLVVRAWDEVRRAIAFIRWHEGDLEQIAPSLYAGRSGRSKPEQAAAPQTEVPQVTPTEAPQVPVGMPGGSPFLS